MSRGPRAHGTKRLSFRSSPVRQYVTLLATRRSLRPRSGGGWTRGACRADGWGHDDKAPHPALRFARATLYGDLPNHCKVVGRRGPRPRSPSRVDGTVVPPLGKSPVGEPGPSTPRLLS